MDNPNIINPELIWLKRDTAEWRRVQHEIELHDRQFPDTNVHFLDTGFEWMYLGTYKDGLYGTSHWQHNFRHYYHPSTGRQENLSILSFDNNPDLYIYY
tara:strand:+ start:1920 stop:2216 length:297 start_codon:yes stop_codon:yes gene_type:complete